MSTYFLKRERKRKEIWNLINIARCEKMTLKYQFEEGEFWYFVTHNEIIKTLVRCHLGDYDELVEDVNVFEETIKNFEHVIYDEYYEEAYEAFKEVSQDDYSKRGLHRREFIE